jgi:glycerol kinase
MNYVLAIDQSTSATKAVLFDALGGVVDRASREHRQIYPQPGWVEHDADQIWQNVIGVVSEVVERGGAPWANIACVSVANQRETVLVFERDTGRPLHHALVWQDRRGDPICQALCEAGHGDIVRAKTGLKLDAYFSASKLKWLLDAKPEIQAALQQGDALIGTMDAYLVYRLTNGAVFATDHTNASRTLLYDVAGMAWDRRLCELFGVPMGALPEVRESASSFGDTTVDGVFPQRMPICGVMGDSQASLFAQRCYEPGMAKATFGSGTSVMLNVGDRLRLSDRGAVSALAWVVNGRPTYALEGLINYSSATISWLKDQLGLLADAGESEPLARAVEDNGGVYLVPAFAGLSAPHWSPTARAAILGMTAHSRREHVVRAGLESIAYQIRDVLDGMRDEADVPLAAIFADGGPTRNEFLMQFTADMTGVALEASDTADSSALGAAMAGMLGCGLYGSLAELAALPRASRRFTPRMPAAEVRRNYAGWQAALQRVL